jgi:hypothetical protein
MAILLILARADAGDNRGEIVEVREDDAPIGRLERPGQGKFHLVQVPGPVKKWQRLMEQDEEWEDAPEYSTIEPDALADLQEHGILRVSRGRKQHKVLRGRRRYKMANRNGDDWKTHADGFRCSTVLDLASRVAGHQQDIQHLLQAVEKMEKWVEGIHRRLDEMAAARQG